MSGLAHTNIPYQNAATHFNLIPHLPVCMQQLFIRTMSSLTKTVANASTTSTTKALSPLIDIGCNLLDPMFNGEIKFGWSSYDFSQSLVSQYQYFDCSLLCSYIRSNLDEMFPLFETPPTQDVILPATEVGLYFKDINDFEADEFHVYKWTEEFDEKEVMFLCNIIAPENPRNFYVVLLERHSENAQFLGTVDSEKGELELAPIWMDQDHKRAVYEAFLRIVCAALDTLNQPRLVVQKPMPLNFLQKQSFRKSTGSFAPAAWNMVSWNVEEPVVARTYDEGRGGRQALHFRRGHWRKAEEHHKNAQWSEKRNRWEKWIAGYTAGDTAFGVKKNYHLPRKEDK